MPAPKVPGAGADSASNPPAGTNTTTLDQRQPDIDATLSDGPKIGPNGEYQPARYKTTRGNIRTDR